MTRHYKKLTSIYEELAVLGDINSILSWDSETYMPVNASENRAIQQAALGKLINQKQKSKRIAQLIEKAKTEHLGEWENRNLYLIEKNYKFANLYSSKMIVEKIKAAEKCITAWREHKKLGNFNKVVKPLKKLFLLTKKQYEMDAQLLKCSPYEAAMDNYDEGRTIKDLDNRFAKLKTFLVPFIDKVIANQKPLEHQNPYDFDIESQKALCKLIVEKMGFDFSKGRLDVSLHPFCGGATNDVRLTTKYDAHNPDMAIFGTIHETGHALYQQHLPKEYNYTLVGRPSGMAIHESQSLFMELQVGNNPVFLNDLYQLLKTYFNDLPFSQESFYQNHKYVRKSFIRIEADEVTYPLHVILRYEIEKELFQGTLDISDLKDAWDQKFEKYFGIKPKNDAEGCMQDVHWYWGVFGYFPAYTMGAMIASQLGKICQNRDITYKNLDSFKDFTKTMNELVHHKANLLGTKLYDSLDKEAKISAEDCFVEYLAKTYLQS